jgi:integrase
MARNRRGGAVIDLWTGRDGAPTARHGRGKRWRARFVDDTGRERTQAFDKKGDAEAWLDDEITPQLASGSYIPPERGAVTVGQMYASWSTSQAHISAKTAATRRSAWGSRVEPAWANVALADVRTSAVRSWVAAMVADGLGAAGIENAAGLLRMILGAAVEDGRLAKNPAAGVRLPKRQHADRGYLSHRQVMALAEAVDGERGGDGLIVRFLAYCGLRWGEMAALRVQDFDMLRRRVNVSRSVTEAAGAGLVWGTPKTHERRSVPFPAALADDLAARMVNKGRADLVFTDQRGGVLRNSNWRARVFDPAVAAVQATVTAQRAKELAASGAASTPEFPSITPHSLRHTAASLAVSAGANVKSVQRMLGHAKASMTLDTYADLFSEDLDAVAVQLDAAIREASPLQVAERG